MRRGDSNKHQYTFGQTKLPEKTKLAMLEMQVGSRVANYQFGICVKANGGN